MFSCKIADATWQRWHGNRTVARLITGMPSRSQLSLTPRKDGGLYFCFCKTKPQGKIRFSLHAIFRVVFAHIV